VISLLCHRFSGTEFCDFPAKGALGK
jgi:hypothetical protein